jgi:hypothetical protein
VGRRFRHLGEEWDAESTGMGHGAGVGGAVQVTDWGVEFGCVSNRSKGPYIGNIREPNPNQVSGGPKSRSFRSSRRHPPTGPRSVRFCGGTGSRRKPTTAGGPNLAGWKSVTPGGCGNWKTRTGA